MCRFLFIIVCIILVNDSCRELYIPEVEANKFPFVVDGLITDEAKPYSIKLSRAVGYFKNSSNDYASIRGAKVTVSDDCGNTCNFTEIDAPGVYVSDPSEFVGVPGRSYTLFIKTIDNIEYRSAPQLLLPNDFTVKVDAEFGTHDQLVDDGSGTLVKETLDGTNIFYTIENNENTLIKFRFDHKTYKEYFEVPEVGGGETKLWGLVQNNDLINITDDMTTSTNNIENHIVCFLPDIKPQYFQVGSIRLVHVVTKLITKIFQYRLNYETYLYYKDINTMLAATGKIFDPIPFQLKGNIKCISDNTIEVLGFFEASSVRVCYYANHYGGKILYQLKSYEPPFDYGVGWPSEFLNN